VLRQITERAWAAGFFDGEGSTYVQRCSTIRIAIGHVDRRPLDRFRAAVRAGNVTGPYDYNKKKNPKWACHYPYQAYGANAAWVMEQLRDFLSEPKLEQWERSVQKLDAARTGRMSSSAAPNN
jgi:hypothetical protein